MPRSRTRPDQSLDSHGGCAHISTSTCVAATAGQVTQHGHWQLEVSCACASPRVHKASTHVCDRNPGHRGHQAGWDTSRPAPEPRLLAALSLQRVQVTGSANFGWNSMLLASPTLLRAGALGTGPGSAVAKLSPPGTQSWSQSAGSGKSRLQGKLFWNRSRSDPRASCCQDLGTAACWARGPTQRELSSCGLCDAAVVPRH